MGVKIGMVLKEGMDLGWCHLVRVGVHVGAGITRRCLDWQ